MKRNNRTVNLFLKGMAIAIITMMFPNIGMAILIAWIIKILFFDSSSSRVKHSKDRDS